MASGRLGRVRRAASTTAEAEAEVEAEAEAETEVEAEAKVEDDFICAMIRDVASLCRTLSLDFAGWCGVRLGFRPGLDLDLGLGLGLVLPSLNSCRK